MVTLTYAAGIKDLIQSLDIDEHTLALALGVNDRTVKRWLNNEGVPQKEARKRLEELSGVSAHLYQAFNSAKAVHIWLRTDNRYLGGIKPVEALCGGRIDRVEAALTALDYGAFV